MRRGTCGPAPSRREGGASARSLSTDPFLHSGVASHPCRLIQHVKKVLTQREARAVPSAFVGEGAYDKQRGSLLPRGGRALVKRLGLGVSKVDWTTTFDFVVKVFNRYLLVPGFEFRVWGLGCRG